MYRLATREDFIPVFSNLSKRIAAMLARELPLVAEDFGTFPVLPTFSTFSDSQLPHRRGLKLKWQPFPRNEAIRMGASLEMSERSVDSFLKMLTDARWLSQQEYGSYDKVTKLTK